jgi:hypothetical protein
MQKEKLNGLNLTGIDKMAIELLSSSLVDKEKGYIKLERLEYSAICNTQKIGTALITVTTIFKDKRKIFKVFYNHKNNEELLEPAKERF